MVRPRECRSTSGSDCRYVAETGLGNGTQINLIDGFHYYWNGPSLNYLIGGCSANLNTAYCGFSAFVSDTVHAPRQFVGDPGGFATSAITGIYGAADQCRGFGPGCMFVAPTINSYTTNCEQVGCAYANGYLFGEITTAAAGAAGGTAAASQRVALNTSRLAPRAIPSAFDEAAAYADELRAPPNPPTAATIAVDRTTGQVYRGTSGQLTVRPGQLEDLLPNPSLEPWRAANCGEVSACASALANGADLPNLDIVTIRVRTGDIFPPSDNCASWVPGGGS